MRNRTKQNGTDRRKKDENGTIRLSVSYSSVRNGTQSLFWRLPYALQHEKTTLVMYSMWCFLYSRTSLSWALWTFNFQSLLQRVSSIQGHLVHHRTTLGHRMVSLLQRFPQFRGPLIHYSTTLGHRMASVLQFSSIQRFVI